MSGRARVWVGVLTTTIWVGGGVAFATTGWPAAGAAMVLLGLWRGWQAVRLWRALREDAVSDPGPGSAP